MSRVINGSLKKVGSFAVVGVVNNLTGYLLFAVLTLMGSPAIPAMTASYCLGMVISYWGNRKYTFNHQGRALPAILRFLVVNAVGDGLNAAILAVLVNAMGLPQLLVQLFAIGCVAVVTFTLMRWWVFSPARSAQEAGRV